jgi:flavodoxin I
MINIIYGSDSGTTRGIADAIAAKLANARTVDVKGATKGDFEAPDLVILGTPTYGLGDLQDDWARGLDLIAEADLTGRKVALFGTGDQSTYADTFVDGVGKLYDAVVARGAEVIGFTSTEGYTFDASKAEREGRFVGLILDEDNQRDLSKARIDAWIGQLR